MKNFLWFECLRVGFLVSTYWIWILGSKFILLNSQSRATVWVLDTCLIVGLRPSIIILITGSLSPKMHKTGTHLEKSVCLWVHTIHIIQLLNVLPSFDILCLGFGMESRTTFLDAITVGVGQCCWLNVVLQSPCPKDLQEQVTHPYVHPVIQRNNLRLCRTVLRQKIRSLHVPTGWNKCSTSKNTQDTSWGWLRVLKVSSKVWVLEQTPIYNAVPCFPHDNIVGNRLCDRM